MLAIVVLKKEQFTLVHHSDRDGNHMQRLLGLDSPRQLTVSQGTIHGAGNHYIIESTTAHHSLTATLTSPSPD